MVHEFLNLIRQGVRAEIKHYTSPVWLTQFIENTAPLTKDTLLPHLGQRLTARLASKLCLPDYLGNIGVIRGGSIRSLMLHEADTDRHFARLAEEVDPRLLGEHPLASAVINKAFGPKDIDIWLRVKEPHQKATEKDELFQEIMDGMQKMGATGTMPNDHQAEFFINGYQVKLTKHSEGEKIRQPLVKVDFFKNGKSVFKLHFGVIPNTKERLENIRWNDQVADGDQLAMGYLSLGYLNANPVDEYDFSLMAHYFAVSEMSLLTHQILLNYFGPLDDPLVIRPNTPFLQEYLRHLRETNFRASYYPVLFNLPEAQQKYYELFIEQAISHDFKKPDQGQLAGWIKRDKNQINNLNILPLTDLAYGLAVNPYVFLLFSFPKHTLMATRLADILAEPREIFSLLDFIAVRTGKSITDSLQELSYAYLFHCRSLQTSGIFMLLDWLKEYGHLPDVRDPNFSTFLKLVNPLELV